MPKKLKRYRLIRAKIQTGDCIEFKSDTIIGKGIRFFTKKKVNHTAKVIRFTEYYEDRLFLLEALNHGIELTRLSERLADHKGEAWLVALKPGLDFSRREIGRNCLKYCNIKYDYWAIFKQIFGRVKPDNHKFFCSEFANWVDRESGLPVKKMDYAVYPGEMQETGVYLPSIKIL